MRVKLPKKASVQLIKRVEKLKESISNGTVKFRNTQRYSYRTLAIGYCERVVLVGDILHVFSKHSDYERFINQPRIV
jgi:hypothetical protein